MDGTTFRAPDSAENPAHFGAHSYASGKAASYPQLRAMSVMAIPTHPVADMAFGQYGQNEIPHAKTLVDRIADHSLIVFDRGFLCAEILLGWNLAGEALPDLRQIPYLMGSALRHGEGRPRAPACSPQARAKAQSPPEYWTARAVRMGSTNRKEDVPPTSLLDRRRFKAKDLAECYCRRWKIETSYRELKQSMLGTAQTLRSQQPAGIEQKIWRACVRRGFDCLQFVPPENGQVAIQAKVEPTDLSFLRALQIFQNEMICAVGIPHGKLPAHLARLRTQLQFAIGEKRRGKYPQCR